MKHMRSLRHVVPVVAAMLAVALSIGPSYGAGVPAPFATSIDLTDADRTLGPDRSTVTISGRLLREPPQGSTASPAGLSGTLHLWYYERGRWVELLSRTSDPEGRFSFEAGRRGAYEVRYLGSSMTQPFVMPLSVYADDLHVQPPRVDRSTRPDGSAFVVFYVSVSSPAEDAYDTPHGATGVCRLLLTPVTDEVQPYNGPYRESSLVVARDGSYAAGFSIDAEMLRRYPQWNATAYFLAGEYHKPSIASARFTMGGGTTRRRLPVVRRSHDQLRWQ